MQIEGALHPKYREPKQYLPVDLMTNADIAFASDVSEEHAREVLERIELREAILKRHAYNNFLSFFQYAFYNDKLSPDGLSIIREPIQPQWYQ